MTREEILNIKELRVLDVAVAENIYKWEYVQTAPEGYWCNIVGNNKGWWKAPDWAGWACAVCENLPYNYSGNIELAWELFKQGVSGYFSERKKFYRVLQEVTSYMYDLKNILINYPDVFTFLKDRFPEAICKTMLIIKAGE